MTHVGTRWSLALTTVQSVRRTLHSVGTRRQLPHKALSLARLRVACDGRQRTMIHGLRAAVLSRSSESEVAGCLLPSEFRSPSILTGAVPLLAVFGGRGCLSEEQVPPTSRRQARRTCPRAYSLDYELDDDSASACTPAPSVVRSRMRRRSLSHRELHRIGRSGWLRAAVLGSNDAIVSTASLMIGVAASEAELPAILIAGVAALVAGALSMAVGEYVSVSSQRDAEHADIARETQELEENPQAELNELAAIYAARGLDADLAMKVAVKLSEGNRVEAHLRDELNIDPDALARPFQAAWISAVSFAVFAAIPVLALVVAPASLRIAVIGAVSLVSLAASGALGAYLGGAPLLRAAMRVTVGGLLAMAISAAVGHLLGVSVG